MRLSILCSVDVNTISWIHQHIDRLLNGSFSKQSTLTFIDCHAENQSPWAISLRCCFYNMLKVFIIWRIWKQFKPRPGIGQYFFNNFKVVSSANMNFVKKKMWIICFHYCACCWPSAISFEDSHRPYNGYSAQPARASTSGIMTVWGQWTNTGVSLIDPFGLNYSWFEQKNAISIQ